jgi:hypothetical protein
MLAIDLPAGEPADAAANQGIRRKVILSANAGERDGGSSSVRENLGERTGVFVTEHAGNRKSAPCVIGRKRLAALPEAPAEGIDGRTLALGGVPKNHGYGQGVERGFVTKQAGLSSVGVVCKFSYSVEACSRAGHSGQAIVRDVGIPMECLRGATEVQIGVGVGDDKTCGDACERDKPSRFAEAKMGGSCPRNL